MQLANVDGQEVGREALLKKLPRNLFQLSKGKVDYGSAVEASTDLLSVHDLT